MSDLLVPAARGSTPLAGDEIAAVLDVLSLDRLPPVLGYRLTRDGIADHNAALRRGRESLRSRGLIDGGRGVDPELRDWMWALVRPRWQLSARVLAGGEIVDRFCIGAGTGSAGNGGPGSGSAGNGGAVVVGRSLRSEPTGVRGPGAPSGVEIRPIAAGAGDVVMGILGKAIGLAVGVSGHPADMFADLLAERHRPARTAALLGRWDIDDRRARVLAEALASEQRYTEIVVERRRHEVPVQVAPPISVIDTAQGRVLAVTSLTADGARWMSLVPGSDRRLAEEIDAAVRCARQPQGVVRGAGATLGID